MAPTNDVVSGPSPRASAYWEQVLARFKEAWQQGQRPRLDDYLPNDADRHKILSALIHIDLEGRIQTGAPVRVEAYLERYPDLANVTKEVLALIAAEYTLRRRREPVLAIDDYLRRFPQYHEELSHLIALLPARYLRPEAGTSEGDPISEIDAQALPRETRIGTICNQPDPVSEADHAMTQALTEERQQYAFLAPPQGPDEIGRLDHYRVLRVLGEGGMGVVFQAEDLDLRRLVALKVIKPAIADIDTARQRFLREARATAALSHEHIVAIHKVGEDRGVPYLAMPMLQGETLEQRLIRERKESNPAPLPLNEVLRIGREIAKGLAAAHEKGLIHRDIKPANIWLVKGTDRVKILDFGLARLTDEEMQLTQSGAVMGTPAYMAPEQAQSAKHVDARCDLFSLGCVLYRLCTGQLAFSGPTTLAILRAVAQKQPKPPRDLNAEVPQALSDLVMQLLAKNPDERCPSASTVVQTLTSIFGELSAPSRRPKANQVHSWLRSSNDRRFLLRWLFGSVALFVCLSALVFSLDFPSGLIPDKEPTPASP